MDNRLNIIIEEMREQILSDCVHVLPYSEISFKEFDTSELFTEILKREGYKVENGISGFPTAFRAIYEHGSGGISIGLLINLDASARRMSHGHLLQGTILIAAASAIRKILGEKNYRIVIYGTPGSQTMVGKSRMLENGCFRDIDFAFMIQPFGGTFVRTKSLSGFNMDVVFTGVNANEVSDPWCSRSGSDAMLQAVQSIEFLRGHIPDGFRIFYRFNDGNGLEGNEDPSRAELRVCVRTYEEKNLRHLETRIRNIMTGIGLIHEVYVDIQKTMEVKCYKANTTLSELIETIGKEIDINFFGDDDIIGGSPTDFSCLSRLLPCAYLYISLKIEPKTLEITSFEEFTKTECDNILNAAKFMAQIFYEVIRNPKILKTARKELDKEQTFKSH